MIKAIEQVPINTKKISNNCIKSVENQKVEEFCSKYIKLL